jgi:hypothetical protein
LSEKQRHTVHESKTSILSRQMLMEQNNGCRALSRVTGIVRNGCLASPGSVDGIKRNMQFWV